MKVVISGASGLIGTALSKALRADGHRVIALVRREARGEDESSWHPARGEIDADLIRSADVVVNLAGASIGGKRLTDDYKRLVLTSRLDSTRLIAGALAERGSGVLIQASSMGYYGDRGTDELTERSKPGDTFLSDIVVQWEGAAKVAQSAGVRVVYSRTGLVLSDHGGFAARLLPLVRRGLLRSLGSGSAVHSWITLHDVVKAMIFFMTSGHDGPANVVAPEPVRDDEMIRAFSAAYGKRPGIPVPAWLLKVAIGPAIIDLLTSQMGVPGVLKRLGFEWTHPTIEDATLYVSNTDRDWV